MTQPGVWRRMLLLLLATALALHTGCVLPADRAEADHGSLQPGMHLETVRDLLGGPDQVFEGPGGQMWVYTYVVGSGVGWWMAMSLMVVFALALLPLAIAGGGGSGSTGVTTSPGEVPRLNLRPDSFPGRSVSLRLHFGHDEKVDWVAPVETLLTFRRWKGSPPFLELRPRVEPGLSRREVQRVLRSPPQYIVEDPPGEMWIYRHGLQSFRIYFGERRVVEWVSPLETD